LVYAVTGRKEELQAEGKVEVEGRAGKNIKIINFHEGRP